MGYFGAAYYKTPLFQPTFWQVANTPSGDPSHEYWSIYRRGDYNGCHYWGEPEAGIAVGAGHFFSAAYYQTPLYAPVYWGPTVEFPSTPGHNYWTFDRAPLHSQTFWGGSGFVWPSRFYRSPFFKGHIHTAEYWGPLVTVPTGAPDTGYYRSNFFKAAHYFAVYWGPSGEVVVVDPILFATDLFRARKSPRFVFIQSRGFDFLDFKRNT